MKINNYFVLQEFVPKSIYDRWGANSMWFLDAGVIRLATGIREYFGKPMTINDWHTGGRFQERGFRPPDTTKGGDLSQHRFGRAIDFNLFGLSPDVIRTEILKNQKHFLNLGLTVLEDGKFAPTWVHADIRNTGLDYILIVKP